MEDHRLQALHDGLSQANNRRGRQGGLGGVAGQGASKNTQTFFNDEGETSTSSGLYANFVKGVTLTASKEMSCSIIKAPRSDEEDDLGEDSAPVASKSDPTKNSNSKRVRVAVSNLTDSAEEAEQPRLRRKKRTPNPDTVDTEPGEATSFAKALGNGGLVRVTLQGSRRSLREHVLAALPRCRRFLLIGGCGAVDVLLQRDEEGAFRKHKKLWAAHLHGTCDFQNDLNNCPSAKGIFRLAQADGEKAQHLHAAFGVRPKLATVVSPSVVA